jgi:hypothetical protein
VNSVQTLDGDQFGNIGVLGKGLDNLAVGGGTDLSSSIPTRNYQLITHATVTGSSETLQAS